MPLYDYKCADCGAVLTAFRSYENRDEVEPHCSQGATRIPSIPMVLKDYEGYVSPASGKWVEGKRAHREDLKRTGCRLFEPGEREDFIKNEPKRREKELEKMIDEVVDASAKHIGLG